MFSGIDKILLAEIAMVLIVVPVVLLLPRRFLKPIRTGFRGLARIANHRRLSIVLVGLLGFSTSAGLSVLNKPVPSIHDEFSYLLAADTFSHGRLTNPTHPMWIHFESIHIIHEPSYASKYPPAQGLLLSAGQVIGGDPIVGVWLGMGLLGASLCWMLQGWLPPRWALIGALLATIHLGYGYWARSFYGGAAAGIGGALVFGTLPRLFRVPNVRDSVLLALGVTILANTRPYEGVVASLPVTFLLLAWWFGKRGPSFRITLIRMILPIATTLVVAVLAMGWYNQSITHNPLLLPYRVHENAYATAPLFFWESNRPDPVYNHAAIRDFQRGETRGSYGEQLTLWGLAKGSAQKLESFWQFYIGPVLTIPLLALPWVIRNAWMRFASLVIGLVAVSALLVTWFSPHYAAPITCLAYLLIAQSLRHLRLWQYHGSRVGRSLTLAVCVGCVGMLVAYAAWHPFRIYPEPWSRERSELLARLEREEGNHLVIVRYSPKHNPLQEWVYNGADLDGAKVVWAREMGPEQNARLLDHYRGRQVWLLEADAQPAHLTPYALSRPGANVSDPPAR